MGKFKEYIKQLKNNTVEELILDYEFTHKQVEEFVGALNENSSLRELVLKGKAQDLANSLYKANLASHPKLKHLEIDSYIYADNLLFGALEGNQTLRTLKMNSSNCSFSDDYELRQTEEILFTTLLTEFKFGDCDLFEIKPISKILKRNKFLVNDLMSNSFWSNDSKKVSQLLEYCYKLPNSRMFDFMQQGCKENPQLFKTFFEKNKDRSNSEKGDLLNMLVLFAIETGKEAAYAPTIRFVSRTGYFDRDAAIQSAQSKQSTSAGHPLLFYLQSPLESALERNLFAQAGTLSQIAYGNVSIKTPDFMTGLLKNIEELISHCNDKERPSNISQDYYNKLVALHSTLSSQVKVGKQAEEFFQAHASYPLPIEQEKAIVTNIEATFKAIKKQLNPESTAVEQGLFSQTGENPDALTQGGPNQTPTHTG